MDPYSMVLLVEMADRSQVHILIHEPDFNVACCGTSMDDSMIDAAIERRQRDVVLLKDLCADCVKVLAVAV